MHWINFIKAFPSQSLSSGMSKAQDEDFAQTSAKEKWIIISSKPLKTHPSEFFSELLFAKPLESIVTFQLES